MKKYILKRFLQLIPVLIGITFLSFAMMRIAGSDAITELYGDKGAVAQEIIDAKRAELGLDQPFLTQYLAWVGGILTGDMGISYISGRDVFQTFVSKLPATLLLTVLAICATVIISILPDQSKNVNLRRLCPLDKSKVSGIIKVTKDASTSGCPRLVYEVKKMFLKPSLCRVAVSPVNADRNSQSKDMESQSDRHRNTPFTEDSGENRPSLFWRPWGSKRTLTILPDQSKNVNQWRMLCHWQKKSMAFYTTGGRCR